PEINQVWSLWVIGNGLSRLWEMLSDIGRRALRGADEEAGAALRNLSAVNAMLEANARRGPVVIKEAAEDAPKPDALKWLTELQVRFVREAWELDAAFAAWAQGRAYHRAEPHRPGPGERPGGGAGAPRGARAADEPPRPPAGAGGQRR